MKKVVLKIRFILIGLKNIFQLNLGDIVIYNGTKCILTQGVYSPEWHMHEVVTNARHEYIHKKKFRKAVSYKNVKNAINGTYRFYMDYWFSIFCRNISLLNCFVVSYKNWSKLVKEKTE